MLESRAELKILQDNFLKNIDNCAEKSESSPDWCASSDIELDPTPCSSSVTLVGSECVLIPVPDSTEALPAVELSPNAKMDCYQRSMDLELR